MLSLVAMRLRADGVARAGGAWTIQALFKVASGALTALLIALLIQQLDNPFVEPQGTPFPPPLRRPVGRPGLRPAAPLMTTGSPAAFG